MSFQTYLYVTKKEVIFGASEDFTSFGPKLIYLF